MLSFSVTDDEENDVTSDCTYTFNPAIEDLTVNTGTSKFVYTAPLDAEVGDEHTTTVTATYQGGTATANIVINIVASE